VALTITTEAGRRYATVSLPTDSATLAVPQGPTRWLRITVDSSTLPPGTTFGLAEVGVPELTTSRTLVTPDDVRATALALGVRTGGRPACVVRQPTQCAPALARPGEETFLDRTVDTAGVNGPVTITAVPRPGAALDALLAPPYGVLASASSTWVPDPSARAQAAVDGDPMTAWLADPADRQPTLRLALPRGTTISWVQVREMTALAASRPLTMAISVGTRHWVATSDKDGFFQFPATYTTTIELQVLTSTPVRNLDSATGRTSVLPVGMSEVIPGDAYEQVRPIPRERRVVVPCSAGPVLRVSGVAPVRTTLTTTVGAILDGSPVEATPCGTAVLPAGARRLTLSPGDAFVGTGLAWNSPAAIAAATSPTISSWSADARTVTVTVAPSVRTLELAENFNPGWSASLDGRLLAPVRVDGWRQAWVLPAEAGGAVSLTFSPDRQYRTALGGGAAAAAVLVVVALLPVRRPRVMPARSRRPVPSVIRVVLLLIATGLTLGGVGVVASLVCVVVTDRRRWRPWVAAGGVMVATALAVVAPWPASTSWPTWTGWVIAVTASAGAGVVLGALVARPPTTIRTGAPTPAPDAPPAGT
jgi:arabinofuranan 3-O-arabinosyltransferase